MVTLPDMYVPNLFAVLTGTPLPVHYQHVGSTATPTTVVVSVSASSSAPEALGVTTAEAYPTAPAARAIDTASHTGGSYAGSSVGMVPLSYSSTPAAHPQHSFSTEQNGSNGGGSGLGWSWFRQAPRNIDRW